MAVRSWDRWGMAVACALLVACSSTVETVADPKVLNLLGFLQSGHVSRNEVEGRMGPPFSTCENDRIVTYRLQLRQDRFEPTPLDTDYHLVLVYRADSVVERWSLIDRSQ